MPDLVKFPRFCLIYLAFYSCLKVRTSPPVLYPNGPMYTAFLIKSEKHDGAPWCILWQNIFFLHGLFLQKWGKRFQRLLQASQTLLCPWFPGGSCENPIPTQQVWGGAEVSAFLRSSQVRLVVLVYGPHLEHQRIDLHPPKTPGNAELGTNKFLDFWSLWSVFTWASVSPCVSSK